MLKKILRRSLRSLGYEVRKLPAAAPATSAPVATSLYRPLYSPWHSDAFERYFGIARPRTLVSPDRCYVLERLLRQTLPVPGEVFECGVYRGGTAALLWALLNEAKSEKRLFLFDTFEGMPETDPVKDHHKRGDFSDTSLESVRAFVGGGERCIFKPGFIPATFDGLDDLSLSFCHIDVDIYRSIMDSLNFIWPRLSTGGVIVFDDYGFPSCPGAKEAVDEFFQNQQAVPLCLQTGQAIVFKGTPHPASSKAF